MKRLSAFCLILLLLGALLVPCCAASSNHVLLSADLSNDQMQAIEAMAQTVQDNYGIEAFFVYDNTQQGGDAFKKSARTFFNNNRSTDDAVLFAVSQTTYYIYLSGDAQDVLKEDDSDELYGTIQSFDERGEVYNTAAAYYAALQSLLDSRKGAAEDDDDDGWDTPQNEPATVVSGNDETTLYSKDDIPPIPKKIAAERAERLYDGADLLSAEDEAALLDRLNTLSESLQFDVVIVTAKAIGERSPMEFADDYYDYNGFGYNGVDKDGCLLLISMADRDWWVSTRGEGITALDSDYFISCLKTDDFMEDLKAGNYDDSFTRFTELVEDFVTEAREDQPYTSDHRYNDWENKKAGIGISLIIGLIVAAIVTATVRRGYVHAVRKKADAGSYLVNGSMRLTQSTDHFMYTHVDRTRRQTESSSSGGGGGTHTSSSGATHGGGGGKF